jgi:ribosomal protein S2
MQSIEKMLNDGSAESLTKKERLTLTRDKEKWKKYWAVSHRSAVYQLLYS